PPTGLPGAARCRQAAVQRGRHGHREAAAGGARGVRQRRTEAGVRRHPLTAGAEAFLRAPGPELCLHSQSPPRRCTPAVCAYRRGTSPGQARPATAAAGLRLTVASPAGSAARLRRLLTAGERALLTELLDRLADARPRSRAHVREPGGEVSGPRRPGPCCRPGPGTRSRVGPTAGRSAPGPPPPRRWPAAARTCRPGPGWRG